jgi:iron(III) transport system ATP-binding protein
MSATPSEPAARPAIEVRGLAKTFGEIVALDDVSFRVAPGELFFLLGPSGCGKTTLLRILAGLETPDAGTVLFDGADVAARPAHRRGAPMVFQNYALWPHLSVAENVGFGLVERGVSRAEIRRRVGEALARVDLPGLEKRLPGQLSGGQQQRVVLARALVLEPPAVLLDEPLSNLDAKLRHEMREEIARLHAETRITFVYVTHDQVEALSLADRLAVMDRGALAGVGAPRELYHRPPNRFCAEFLGETNLLPGTVAEAAGERLTVRTPHGAWRGVRGGSAELRAGAEALCAVRPEHLNPGPAPAGANGLTARVRETRMTGPTVTVDLEAGAQALRAAVLNRHQLSLAAGARGPWHAAAEDTVVLPAGEDRA